MNEPGADVAGRLPLQGLRVVSLEQAVAAPLCTRHLADLGADVVKVERPDVGDFARHFDSAVQGLSANFVWLNHGKSSVTIDLKSASGKAAMWSLIVDCDVFVHNLGPGAIDRLGFDYASVHARAPRAIWCGISGYGVDGPYANRKGFDLLVQGEVGLLSITGTSDRPAKTGIAIADSCAGVYAFASILATLYEREHTAEGARIDISLFDSMAEWMNYPALLQASGQEMRPAGMRHAAIVPYGPYRCRDRGLVNLAVENEDQWRRLCVALGRTDWLEDRRYGSVASRLAHREVLETALESTLEQWTAEEVLARLEIADVPTAQVNDLRTFVDHPQLVERGRWAAIEGPDGPLRVISHPMNIAGLARRTGRVPSLGQDNDAILKGDGSSLTVRALSGGT